MWISAGVVFDETQLDLYLSKDAATKYGRGEQRSSGVSVCATMVQIHEIHVSKGGLPGWPGMRTQNIVPPLIVEDERAETVVESLMQDNSSIRFAVSMARRTRAGAGLGQMNLERVRREKGVCVTIMVTSKTIARVAPQPVRRFPN